MYFQCLFGEDFLDIFRPFDYAQISAVNVVKETDIEGLFDLYSLTMENVGELTASSLTPNLLQSAVVNVVLPAPIGA